MGVELVRAGAGLFLEAADALWAGVTLERWDDAREAHMARRLAQLLARGETVLWVGGMLHWTRMVRRINGGNFDAPSVDLTRYSSFKRMRLAPSAMYRITGGRLPWLIAHYAQVPSAYEEFAAMQTLCLEATKSSVQEASTLVPIEQSDDRNTLDEIEACAPIDIARTLQYARNLAAIEDLRERPNLAEVMTAAAQPSDRNTLAGYSNLP